MAGTRVSWSLEWHQPTLTGHGLSWGDGGSDRQTDRVGGFPCRMKPMDRHWLERNESDAQRGTALLVTGAVLVVLKWLVPYVAPVSVAAYGVYALYHRHTVEGLVALGVAVLLWMLRAPLGALLWLVGAVIAACGLFFLIRGLRT
jgi:hypothetical protein